MKASNSSRITSSNTVRTARMLPGYANADGILAALASAEMLAPTLQGHFLLW
jgi:hypothetical protein